MIPRALRPVIEGLQSARFAWRHRGDAPVLLIHQMARVGSISVLRAIRRAGLRVNLFHTHYLHADSIRHFETQHVRNVSITGRPGLHRELMAARWLTRRLPPPAGRPWRVISLVRDPVARTISAFFRHFQFTHPDLGSAFLADVRNVPRLCEMYLAESEFEHEFALGWFEREVREVFGLDVYAEPFPHGEGWATYAVPGCELLLLRLEDLTRVGAPALERFLGARGIGIGRDNASEREPYAETWRAFVRALPLSDAYLDRMYGSRLARHFYTEAERAAFRARARQAAG